MNNHKSSETIAGTCNHSYSKLLHLK